MDRIATLADLINVLTSAIGIAVDSTIHVHPTSAGRQSKDVVLAIDLLYPSPGVGYLADKGLLRNNIDAFASVEPGFDESHGVFLEFSAAVVAELQQRDVAQRIRKLNALRGMNMPKPERNVAHLQWAMKALGL